MVIWLILAKISNVPGGPLCFNMWQGIAGKGMSNWQAMVNCDCFIHGRVEWQGIANVGNKIKSSWGASALTCGKGLQARVGK